MNEPRKKHSRQSNKQQLLFDPKTMRRCTECAGLGMKNNKTCSACKGVGGIHLGTV